MHKNANITDILRKKISRIQMVNTKYEEGLKSDNLTNAIRCIVWNYQHNLRIKTATVCLLYKTYNLDTATGHAET